MHLRVARMICRMVLGSLAAVVCMQASAQTVLLDDVHTVATVQTGVPIEHDFQVSQAGTYLITLIDLGAQAPTTPLPLASLKMAVTANDALVGTPLVVQGTGAPTPAPGMGTFTLVAPASATYPATYRIHVIGASASGKPPGPISVQVIGQGSTTVLDSWNDVIAPPPQQLPSTEALLQDTYTVTTAGSYAVTLTDLALPHTLATATMILIQTGSSNAYILPNPSTQTLMLAAGTYQIYALGAVGSGATGGLFSVTITPPSGVSGSYGRSQPVGTTAALGNPTLAAGAYALTASDLAFPTALAQLATMLVNSGVPVSLTIGGGAPVTTLAAGQSGAFTVSTGGTYQVYAAAAPATAAPGAGSYVAQISAQGGSGAPAFSAAQVATTPVGSALGYEVTDTIATAGSYTAGLTDFQVPAALVVADLAVVQNGALVGTPLTVPGTSNVSLAAGPVTLLVIAQGGTSGSTFDLSLADAKQDLVIDQPEAAGVTFAATKVSITTTGTYDITLNDLLWPAPFGTLAGIVTQGGTLVGQIFGGGTLNAIKANAGNYYVNILAAPTTGTTNPDDAGTYVVNVSQAPAAPTVMLTADATSVTSGGTVHLLWTTTGATSCVASGGGWTGTFTGSQATSSTVTSPAIVAATTFTLTCTGPGGTQAGTVSVSIKASGSGGGGGGGALSILGLLALAACVVLRGSTPARPQG
jgi:hypothetical protein